MSTARKCPRCGAELGDNELGGLCPDCVIKHIVAPLARESVAPSNVPWAGEANLSAGPESQPRRLRYFGDYELLEEIATGGMGIVYRARQISLNRIVAVKMIRAGLLAGDAEVRRFHAEAEAAASLDHPNIVPLYEVGEHGGQQYFSMKLIEGGTLTARIQDGCWFKEHCVAHQPFSVFAPGRTRCCSVAATLMAKVARAVHYAHQRGILHRDLKPGNILLDAQGEPHITDFGLALRLESETHLTMSGTVLGTPSYMSPEQAAGKVNQLTTAADIYSLGAILYELLTGQPPFRGGTPLETLRCVVEDEPTRPGALNFKIDPDLDTICLKCLEKDPQRRYASAAELAHDLDRFERCQPILARRSTVPERMIKWTRRHPVHAAGSTALLLVFFAGVAGITWEWRRAEQALRVSQESLWQANFDRAHALRTSRQMGQRVEALKAIRAAAAIRPTPALREEAIAAMALTDLEDVGDWLPSPTNLVSYAADGSGERVALSLADGTVEVRRIPEGRLLALVNTGQQRPNLRLDDAGERLLTGDRTGSRVWDLRTTNLLDEVRTPPDLPESAKTYRMFGGLDAALSPDGRWLAYLSSTSSVAWRQVGASADSGYYRGSGTLGCMAFNGSAELLAFESPTGPQVCRVADGTGLATMARGGFPLVWHPSEPLLAMGFGTEVGVCGLATNEIQKLTGVPLDGVFPCWHPDGNLLATAAWDQVLRLWDPFGGVQLLETTFARASRFSTNGQWLMVNNPRGVGRLKVHVPQECRVLHLPLGRTHSFGAVFSPDDRFLTGLSEGEVWIWEVASGRLLSHHPLSGRLLDFVSQHALVTIGPEGIVLWTNSMPTAGSSPWQPSVIVEAAGRDFQEASFNAAHSLLVVKQRGAGEVYDFPSGQSRSKLTGQRLFSYQDISPDGRWVASGYFDNNGRQSSEFWIWSAADGQPVRKIPSGNCAALFSPDGQWLLLCGEKEYSQYAINGHPTNWTLVRQFTRDFSGFNPGSANFSPDGKLLAIMADSHILRLIESASGRELARFPCGVPMFSHNGRWFAASSDIGLHVWDLQLIRQRLGDMGLDWE